MKPEALRRPVIVLGMHRSGTSALTRALGLIGWQLPSDPGTARQSNPAGQWEPTAVNDLNDRLLGLLGHHWAEPGPMPAEWEDRPEIRACRDTALRAFESSFRNTGNFVLKDPRMSLTLPFWRKLLSSRGIEPCYLIACRNPIEVAGSLGKRDGITSAHAAALWSRYMLDAERNSAGHARTVVRYDELLKDWRTTLANAAERLGTAWQEPDAVAAVDVDRFVDSGLRHHRSGEDSAREPDEIEMRFALRTYRKFRHTALDDQSYWNDAREELNGILQARGGANTPSKYLTSSAIWKIAGANELMASQEWDGALAAAREAVRLGPEVTRAHAVLARILLKRGEHAEAGTAMARARELGAGELDYAYFMCRVALASGDIAKALDHALRVWEIGSENPYHNVQVAKAAARNSRLDLAVPAIEKAMRIDGNHADWHWFCIRWLIRSDQTEKAAAAAKIAFERFGEKRFEEMLNRLSTTNANADRIPLNEGPRR